MPEAFSQKLWQKVSDLKLVTEYLLLNCWFSQMLYKCTLLACFILIINFILHHLTPEEGPYTHCLHVCKTPFCTYLVHMWKIVLTWTFT